MEGLTSTERSRRRLARRQSIWVANKRRRALAAAAKACVNETYPKPTHGPATHGVRCKRCYDVHRYGAEAVRWPESSR